jgi:hypothetical protein
MSVSTLFGTNLNSISLNATNKSDSSNCVSIGYFAGDNTGDYSLSLGAYSYYNSSVKYDKVICLNATGSVLLPDASNGLYVKPIRQSQGNKYSRGFNYLGSKNVPSGTTLSNGQSITVGTLTVDPQSTCVQGSIDVGLWVQFPPSTGNTSVVAIDIYDDANTLIESYSNSLIQSYPLEDADQSYSASATPALFNNSSESPKTLTVKARKVSGNDIVNIWDGNNNDSYVNINFTFQLTTTTLPTLHYDPTTGEITYL